MNMGLMQLDIRRLDVYRKVPKDMTEPTYIGACISIVTVALTLLLFFSELISYLTPELESSMYVDNPGREELPVALDITLHEVKCDNLAIDVLNDLEHREVIHSIGSPVRVTGGDLPDKLLKEPLENSQGCNLTAYFKVTKFSAVIAVVDRGSETSSFKHTINKLRFGHPVGAKIKHYWGMDDTSFEPLDGVNYTCSSLTGREVYEYLIKIVPTLYDSGVKLTPYRSFQFTSLQKKYEKDLDGNQVMPAVLFKYQLTPITVKYTLKPKPFYHFLTTVCAIIGGTFTVAGIFDSFIFSAHQLYKKMN